MTTKAQKRSKLHLHQTTKYILNADFKEKHTQTQTHTVCFSLISAHCVASFSLIRYPLVHRATSGHTCEQLEHEQTTPKTNVAKS